MDISGEEQERNESVSYSTKLDEILGSKTYDPDQNKEEKRWLRREYRNLISTTEENRLEYLRPDSEGLSNNIARANDLHQKVKNTHEATLDSRLLVLTSDLGVQKARRMRLDNNSFDVENYITKLITFMGGRQIDNDNEEPDLNWTSIGKLASKFTTRVPTSDFMLGPLSVETKEREKRIRHSLNKDKSAMKEPEQLKEKDIERQENETTRNVKMVYDILGERQPINFFEFIINPESFGQTVENLFYLSFLIRDGKVNIDDESGQPILTLCEPPTADNYAEGLIKKQLVMEIDMKTWQEIIETYEINESVIPTRISRQRTTGKWLG
ncbi:Nse4 C-terminal-domain-containing protein [Glomus cerebriforme]|uniref:Non-structural maintenance of chromosomes element 4 n=1 Tax=Glomus cerebriforme TaxID=658196 RepID=A0A397TI96_9GLOM|nr:Nse4 C-terminal-domain-containing protein [Glomus cerebriforme]